MYIPTVLSLLLCPLPIFELFIISQSTAWRLIFLATFKDSYQKDMILFITLRYTRGHSTVSKLIASNPRKWAPLIHLLLPADDRSRGLGFIPRLISSCAPHLDTTKVLLNIHSLAALVFSAYVKSKKKT